MNSELLTARFVSLLGEAGVRENEPMSAHTTFKTGGPADLMLLPRTEEGLVSVFQLMEARNRLLAAKAEKIRVRLQYELTSRLAMYYQTGSFINH